MGKQNKQKLVNNLGGLRPGMNQPEKTHGLRLSNIAQQKLIFFRVNPDNSVFEEMKHDHYLDNLEKDIKDNGILHPLIATQDGLLIEGHSRLGIAQKLNLPTIPCRLILDELTSQQLKERVYLGNLNRFEITPDHRTALFAALYPDYFLSSRDEHQHRSKPVQELAKEMGVSPRQVQREREVVALSLDIKKSKGDSSPLQASDMPIARKELRQQKLLATEAPKSPSRKHYKFVSENSTSYTMLTQNDVKILSINPESFGGLEQMDEFLQKAAKLYSSITRKNN